MPLEWLSNPFFWTALAQIIAIDLLLGGDNAVVIAMACRRLPKTLQTKAIYGGMAGAVAVRVVMLFFALQLLAVPYLKLVGAVLLLWVGIKLAANRDDDAEDIDGGTRLWTAIKTIIVADVVMSLDNVLAVAGAGNGNLYLVAAGVLISIPIIVLGSRFVLAVMERFPVVVQAGAALIGWIAGSMASQDLALFPPLAPLPWLHWAVSGAGAVLVVLVGKWLGSRKVVAAES
ncbi:TerC family protein [Pseudomonas eucalypticola]|uniref:TerC family protein n=1 Tax=Pseudomonas eucalypticola TaxID=2599595 RepID=A0A7D5D7R2_9PSED|nr:TerC family protein [Pseudomonas eucalypticola]QKZ04255.1 TerC family protein [Pseudomonas eucalypticola]